MHIAVRVDASPQIGTGHFMRCLTLADALKQCSASVRFVCRHLPKHLSEMLSAGGHECTSLSSGPTSNSDDDVAHSHWLGTNQAVDARETVQALSDQQWDWLVVDHYALDFRWETALRGTAKRILAIDDIADRKHDCDVLLDQNLYSDMDTRYIGKMPAHCQLLLGPRYALLREEFRRLREQIKPRSGSVKRVLVFFGGVDADNYTARTIDAVAAIDRRDLEVDVVIGSQHPFREQIQAKCAKHGFACHVQTTRMAELMASADLAIGAGGSSSWERCCLGLPALVVPLADNQRRLVEGAAIRGMLYSLVGQGGAAPSLALALHLQVLMDSPQLLQAMSRKGFEVVDGQGVQRVLRAIGCSSIGIRKATLADSDNLLAWRNHPSIRAVSRNREPIERSSHEAWLKAVLADPNKMLLIGEIKGEAVGVVRFDVSHNEAEVSIHLAPAFMQAGLGSELLSAAEFWLISHGSEALSIKAEVLGGNQRSHHLFQSSGYQLHSAVYLKRFN